MSLSPSRFDILSVNGVHLQHKSIFLVSKIYPAYTVYVAFACHVQRFLQTNDAGAAQEFCEQTSLSQFYANLDKCG